MKSLATYTLITVFILLQMGLNVNAKPQSNAPTKDFPELIIGAWQVLEVHVDTRATRTLSYRPNDYRLTGRVFVLGWDKVSSNTPEALLCTNPVARTDNMTFKNLMATSMAGRGTSPENPTPKDYALTIGDNKSISIITLTCQEGLWANGLGREGGIEGAWIVALSAKKLAVRWYDETVLILEKLSENAAPKASFDCKNASTDVEKAICASEPLAAFDLSVTQSYLSAVKRYKALHQSTDVHRLYTQQKAWLVERNSCGAHIKCLQDAMASHLEALANEGNF